MKRLKLNGVQTEAKNERILEKYTFFIRYNLQNLANLYKNDIKDDLYYFYIINPDYEKDLKKYGFIEKYNDWTNQVEFWILEDNDLKIQIPVKLNKKNIAYVQSNMDNNKYSEKLIMTLDKMISNNILHLEKIEEKKN